MDQQVQDSPDQAAPSDAMRDALHKASELRTYATQYISARIDLARLSARNIGLLIALGAVGLLAIAAAIVISLVLLFMGIAGAVAALMGGREWAGNLIVGAVLLAIFAAGGYIGIRLLKRAWFRATVKKYESTQREQLQAFGQNSRDRAASQGDVPV